MSVCVEGKGRRDLVRASNRKVQIKTTTKTNYKILCPKLRVKKSVPFAAVVCDGS